MLSNRHRCCSIKVVRLLITSKVGKSPTSNNNVIQKTHPVEMKQVAKTSAYKILTRLLVSRKGGAYSHN